MADDTLRLLILGAHPDDAEFHAGGLAVRYRRLGHSVRCVSVTDGGAGHHRLDSETLIATRRTEARRAGELIGAEYHVWEFPDAALEPTLDVRGRIIREIRSYAPDLVLTHRPCDYHPDHRAVGQAVQDASYLVTVPLVLPEVPHRKKDPVVAYMNDLFTRPVPFRPDVVLNVSPERSEVLAMLAAHVSQVFDFLPYNLNAGDVPEASDERMQWLANWYGRITSERPKVFREALRLQRGTVEPDALIEAYEISEYARQPDAELLEKLFPAGEPSP